MPCCPGNVYLERVHPGTKQQPERNRTNARPPRIPERLLPRRQPGHGPPAAVIISAPDGVLTSRSKLSKVVTERVRRPPDDTEKRDFPALRASVRPRTPRSGI